MKRLRLQMRMTIDGFVADPEGKLDWMTVNLDEKVQESLFNLADASDTLIMGRKMAPGFFKYWESVADENTPGANVPFAKKLVSLQKIIFSKTQKETSGRNARIESGDLKTEVEKLKKGSGKDLLVYGGANFVTSLNRENLIDDYYFLVVPVTLGKGLRIFETNSKLKLVESIRFGNGVVRNHYTRI